MTDRELIAIEAVFQTPGWKTFEAYLHNVKIPALEDRIFYSCQDPGDLLALIRFRNELKDLILDFKTHITTESENNE